MQPGYPRRRVLVWAGAVGLIALHIGAPDRPGLVAGWVPWDLAFHLGWMIAAGLLVEIATRVAWRDVDGGSDG